MRDPVKSTLSTGYSIAPWVSDVNLPVTPPVPPALGPGNQRLRSLHVAQNALRVMLWRFVHSSSARQARAHGSPPISALSLA